jgi:molybdate transport system substrate-binding protein
MPSVGFFPGDSMKKLGQFFILCAFFCLTTTSLRAEELTVSAAISLKEAFTQIAQLFEQQNPGAKVLLNFGSSGELAAQIERGAPADVFASAALQQVESLAQKGLLVKNSTQVFARNRLVIVTPVGVPPINTWAQLAKVERIAIGNPKTVPAGQYAKAALTNAKLYDLLTQQQKLIFGENVRQVLAYVAKGEVDAGLVYATDARTESQVRVGLTVPYQDSPPIVYPLALVQDSRHLPLGRQFVALVLGAQGQRILQQFGFLSP